MGSYPHACESQPASGAGSWVGKAGDQEVEEGSSHPHVLDDLQTSVWTQAGLAGKLVCSLP